MTLRPRRARRACAAAGLLLAAGLTAACGAAGREPPAEVPGGNPQRGAQLISDYGCGSCHTVPGVRNADALVGPPLTKFGKRTYIAGELSNTGPHLQQWVMNPQEVEPGTAMPDLGVSARDARDIAAYLFTLR